MIIRNFSHLKSLFKEGHDFVILEHFIKPELSGQIREISKVQTNGLYSKVKNEPDNPVSLANHGQGYWMPYEKASNWVIENNTCTFISVNSRTGETKKCFKLEILEKEV